MLIGDSPCGHVCLCHQESASDQGDPMAACRWAGCAPGSWQNDRYLPRLEHHHRGLAAAYGSHPRHPPPRGGVGGNSPDVPQTSRIGRCWTLQVSVCSPPYLGDSQKPSIRVWHLVSSIGTGVFGGRLDQRLDGRLAGARQLGPRGNDGRQIGVNFLQKRYAGRYVAKHGLIVGPRPLGLS